VWWNEVFPTKVAPTEINARPADFITSQKSPPRVESLLWPRNNIAPMLSPPADVGLREAAVLMGRKWHREPLSHDAARRSSCDNACIRQHRCLISVRISMMKLSECCAEQVNLQSSLSVVLSCSRSSDADAYRCQLTQPGTTSSRSWTFFWLVGHQWLDFDGPIYSHCAAPPYFADSVIMASVYGSSVKNSSPIFRHVAYFCLDENRHNISSFISSILGRWTPKF